VAGCRGLLIACTQHSAERRGAAAEDAVTADAGGVCRVNHVVIANNGVDNNRICRDDADCNEVPVMITSKC